VFSWLKHRRSPTGLTAFVTHADCLKHDMGSGHPECPDRLIAIRDQLMAVQLFDSLHQVEAPEASQAELARVHPTGYIDYLESCAPQQGTYRLDPDTAMSPGTLRAARLAAGAVVRAVDMVCGGEAPNAFCSVRPPGHHAERARSMGFCFFNNLAVGVAHALEKYGLERIAIADFDVHHGNGTEEIFQDEKRVMMVSTFQSPYYPFSGEIPLGANMHNVPLKAGSKGAEFRSAVEQHWLPALHAFQPQMIFISAGFDAHREDDMAALGLVEADYAWVTRQLMQIADLYGEGRIVSVLEGGYDLPSLSRSVAAHVRVLSEG
jgi:acetoin utilization deacetylase AcuC-like enzyme